MKEMGWDEGQDREELFELAMHPQQYRAYKSGEAKQAFEEDLAIKKREGAGLITVAQAKVAAPVVVRDPETLYVDVEGESYKVSVSYGAPETTKVVAPTVQSEAPKVEGGTEIVAPLEGKFYLTVDNTETPIKVGDLINEGDLIGYVEAMKTFNAIKSEFSGTVVKVLLSSGVDVDEDDVLVILS